MNLHQNFLELTHDNPLGVHLGRMKALQQLLNVVYTCRKYDGMSGIIVGNVRFANSISLVYPSSLGNYSSHPSRNLDICCVWISWALSKKVPNWMSTCWLSWIIAVSGWKCSCYISAKTHVIVDILIKKTFTRWGPPTYLVSDWGPQFASQLLPHASNGEWLKNWPLNITLKPTWQNRTLKTMIASYVKDNHRHWDRWVRVPLCLESTSHTPAKIATGHKLKGPMEQFQ